MAPIDVLKFTRALEARGPARRSTLHKWLLANHAKLSPVLDRADRSWLEAAKLIEAEGLAGANGKPVSPKALRQMWLRVSRDAERAREAAATVSALPRPSRSRPRNDWYPPVVTVPAKSAGPSDDWLPSPTRPKAPAASSEGNQRRDAENEASTRLAEIKRIIAERSGH